MNRLDELLKKLDASANGGTRSGDLRFDASSLDAAYLASLLRAGRAVVERVRETGDTGSGDYIEDALRGEGPKDSRGEKSKADSLFEALKHGDEDHQEWLKSAIDAHFAGKSVPAPYGMGTKEVRIKQLEAENKKLRKLAKMAIVCLKSFNEIDSGG